MRIPHAKCVPVILDQLQWPRPACRRGALVIPVTDNYGGRGFCHPAPQGMANPVIVLPPAWIRAGGHDTKVVIPLVADVDSPASWDGSIHVEKAGARFRARSVAVTAVVLGCRGAWLGRSAGKRGAAVYTATLDRDLPLASSVVVSTETVYHIVSRGTDLAVLAIGERPTRYIVKGQRAPRAPPSWLARATAEYAITYILLSTMVSRLDIAKIYVETRNADKVAASLEALAGTISAGSVDQPVTVHVLPVNTFYASANDVHGVALFDGSEPFAFVLAGPRRRVEKLAEALRAPATKVETAVGTTAFVTLFAAESRALALGLDKHAAGTLATANSELATSTYARLIEDISEP